MKQDPFRLAIFVMHMKFGNFEALQDAHGCIKAGHSLHVLCGKVRAIPTAGSVPCLNDDLRLVQGVTDLQP